MTSRPTLRERNRLAAMRVVQATAVAAFEEHGFKQTSIEAIAAAAGVSPSTIYRHFGTKEAIVVWDEREAIIDRELERRLGVQPPLIAFRDAAIAAFAARADEELFRRRLRLIYADASILGAAAQESRVDTAQLAAAFALVDGRTEVSIDDEAVAAGCLAALDVAFDRWQRDDDEVLGELIRASLDAVMGTSE